MASPHMPEQIEFNLRFDDNEAVTQWDSNGKYSLLLVEHGSISLRINGVSLLSSAPCLLFINQGIHVEFINATRLRVSRIVFEPISVHTSLKAKHAHLRERQRMYRKHYMDKPVLFAVSEAPNYGLLSLSDTLYQRMSTLFAGIRNHLDDRYSSQQHCFVRDSLLAILSLAEVIHKEITGPPTFLSALNAPKSYISIVTDYLHTNYKRKVTVDELCSLVGVNRNELSRQFKFYSGKTMMTYLLDCRLEHAADALLLTDRTLLDIAQDCGFNSETYFIRMFKRRFGMTPTQYRKIQADKRK